MFFIFVCGGINMANHEGAHPIAPSHLYIREREIHLSIGLSCSKKLERGKHDLLTNFAALDADLPLWRSR